MGTASGEPAPRYLQALHHAEEGVEVGGGLTVDGGHPLQGAQADIQSKV